MFNVRFPLAFAPLTAAARAADAPEEEVLSLRQVQLYDTCEGALHETRQVSFDADDQVRPVRVPHALQVESGSPFEKPHGRRHVQVFTVQFHGTHQAEFNSAHPKPPS